MNRPSARHFAMIGHGALGREIVRTLDRLGENDSLRATLVRVGADAPRAVHDVAGLIAARPDVVVECAGHEAVRAYVPALLAAGLDCVVSSIGVLADAAVARDLAGAERRGGGRLLLPAGAIAGLDGLAAAALAGITRVTYISLKPPQAWRGTAAETMVDLAAPAEEQTFFTGTAREAALRFPKNANVAVAVALAGIGLEATQVRLIASRRFTDPFGVIEAEGAFGRCRFEMLALASPENPKSSALTAYSLLQAARLGNALPVWRLPATAGG